MILKENLNSIFKAHPFTKYREIDRPKDAHNVCVGRKQQSLCYSREWKLREFALKYNVPKVSQKNIVEPFKPFDTSFGRRTSPSGRRVHETGEQVVNQPVYPSTCVLV